MKDIEWLRNEINELSIIFIGFSILKQREEFGISKDDVMELIEQLDESEENQLDKKIKNLESFNDFLIRSNNQLRNAMDNQEVEIETQPNLNQFYWFTSKITPRFTDVTYTNKNISYCGFKTVPDYSIIEFCDLRFITHATLDELIEQFR